MSHTPGPWRVEQLAKGWNFEIRSDARREPIASVEIWPDGVNENPTAGADALLIAAAPELYEAAQLALTVIDFCLPYITNESDRRVVAEQALRAAIAKAEGR